MTRHDPLSALSPDVPAPMPAPAKPKKKPARAAHPCLAAIPAIPDAMLSHLVPARSAAETRAEFLAFCTERPHFTDWRLAWAAYSKLVKLPVAFTPPAPSTPVPVTVARTVQTPAPGAPAPLWLQLHRQRTRAAA